jgi:hypothetical protein
MSDVSIKAATAVAVDVAKQLDAIVAPVLRL